MELADVPVPPEIKFASQIFDNAFSPTHNIIASGLITGNVHVHRYSVQGNDPVYELNYHKKAVRALQYTVDGQALFCGSADNSISMVDMNTGQLVSRLANAHLNPINAMCVINDHLIASGDDCGVIKAWDLRQQMQIMDVKVSEEYISDFDFNDNKKTLIATSGAGTLSALNMRKREVIHTSEPMDEELLSVAIMKNGKKVVCGSIEGVLDIFSWDEWGDISDRFVGHPDSVDSIVKLDEDTLVTASADGLIRVIQIQPHSMLGVLGMHMDCPVERIRLSPDKSLLSSCSHDRTVKFWDVSECQASDQTEQQSNQSLQAQMSTSNAVEMAEDDFFADL